MTLESLSGKEYSLQITHLENLTNDIESTIPFLVKNVSGAAQTLNVKLAENEDYIETVFDPGWNPELLVGIKYADGLQIGY